MSNVRVINQYIKDLSFEVPKAVEIFTQPQKKPDIALSIDINANKIAAEVFEITLKIGAKASTDAQQTFICEIVYGGIFSIQKIEDEMLEQILLIYCPNLLFPFIRRIIANLTIDGGFPPLMIDPIDFADLYNRRKAASESVPINDTEN